MDGKPGGLSTQTVGHFHTIIRRALADAVRWGLVVRNVAEVARSPRISRRQFQVLGPEHVVRLLAAADGHWLYPLIYLTAHTGLRRGELLELRWSDVNLDAGKIQVRRAR
ncbi:MAG: tyrosine-type recombinase/integrase [Firmicutes bacterium]|nr:tyrosine-type recombinase/integrase [Bacillota bacterium]